MNSKNYPAYVKSKEKSEQEVEKKSVEENAKVDIKDFDKIEILTRDGKVIGIYDISRFDGFARFS